jgi:hypothetical protein
VRSAFERTLIIGSTAPDALEGEVLNVPEDLIDGRGRLRVQELMESVASQNPERRPILIVSDKDLYLRPLSSLFGFADRQRRIAIVSTFRIGGGDTANARLRNEIEHEWGHLTGLQHCRAENCLMRPVSRAEDLDTRPASLCDRCLAPRSRNTGRVAAAIAFLVLLTAGFNYVPPLVMGPSFQMPFT